MSLISTRRSMYSENDLMQMVRDALQGTASTSGDDSAYIRESVGRGEHVLAKPAAGIAAPAEAHSSDATTPVADSKESTPKRRTQT